MPARRSWTKRGTSRQASVRCGRSEGLRGGPDPDDHLSMTLPDDVPRTTIAPVADGWDELATALNHWGIVHIAPGRVRRNGVPQSACDLFDRLFRSTDPRLHQAAVLLLMTHPALAPDASSAIDGLDGDGRDRAMRRYVAAAALQRMARTRIQTQLGPSPVIPAAYVNELGLPSLDDEFGRAALLELAHQEGARYGYDAWRTYRSLLDLFLAETRRRGWGRHATAG